MLTYTIAEKDGLGLFLQLRLEMLRVVNYLADEYQFRPLLLQKSRENFLNADYGKQAGRRSKIKRRFRKVMKTKWRIRKWK